MIDLVKKLEKMSMPPWSYSTYMATALYDEEIGYYMGESTKLGKEGDFYTSNHVHPVFQKTFGRFFQDVILKEEIPPLFCEWGAGDGRFAFTVLSYLQEVDKECFNQSRYIIIEASPYHQEVIREKLRPFSDRVFIYSNFEEVRSQYPTFEGIIFSNEFLDAIPVHVVEKKQESLFEVRVDIDNKKNLYEVLTPCEDGPLVQWIEQYGPELPIGHRFEISLSMKEWIRSIENWLQKGLVVTVDYGYSNEELLSEQRREGSLRGYYKHQLINDPLQHPGEMDLTAHVQWDAYRKIAKENGLIEVFHDFQDKFLLKAGLFTFLQAEANVNPFSESFKQNRAIHSLVYPGGISSTFHVNVQGVNLKNKSKYNLFTEDPYFLK
ncbi:SAM-dependent methyltransferase [Evansella sp. AB-P1]|uniref:class I SAM-dependent methyltransferase n=1 Tax=Evansella sp. AB-P1 TaxID=3037653 RepID=UPI00241DE4DB|nr:SAM-dependent methyltransferase [Evansella sp. AB-P1]MDG5788732.1 SAM-dependent methyltransferase [Evansella sp. AB-P1]